MKVLVIGKSGQLGKSLMSIVNDNWKFVDRSVLDLQRPDSIAKILTEINPDIIINAAAYTAVDLAEKDELMANLVNHLSPGKMAHWCHINKKQLIHISTDYVFDGNHSRPYIEEDSINPQGVYGKTKAAGERLVMENFPGAIIIRTSWLYSCHGKNFFNTMLKLGVEKPELRVVCDQVGTPTYAHDLAHFLCHIIDKHAFIPGIYHFSNEGVASWYDFAASIMELNNLSCKIVPIPTAAYPTPAKRPHYSVLDKTKIKDTFGYFPRHWREALKTCSKSHTIV